MIQARRFQTSHRVAPQGGDGASFSPTQLGGLVLWLRADRGITLGGTLLLTGTSPAVTITGTAATTPGIRLKITTGGIVGTAKFDASADNGASFFATAVPTAASVPLTGPLTGITAAFAAGTYVLNDTFDATVSQWNDQSGAGNHVVQATAANQPIYLATDASFAARQSIKSIGTQFLRKATTNLFGSGPYTIVTSHLLASTVGDPVIVASGRAAGGVSFHTNGGNRSIIHNAVANHDDAAPSTVNPEIWTGTRDTGAAPLLWVNGTSQTLSNTGSLTMTDPGATGLIEIMNLATGNVMTGRMAEVLMYSRALAVSEVISVNRYLGARYGITVT